jgi:hypothetical protein
LARFTAPPTPREPVLKSSQIKPYDLAVALSLLEGDQYKALQPADYLLYLSKGQSDGVKKYHSTNEKIRLWVISSILRSDTVLQRSEVMKFFIYTALASSNTSYHNRVFSRCTPGMPVQDAKLLINRGYL